MQQREFLEWLRREIPLTAAMQIDSVEFDGKCLSLHAPLAPNLNDKGTGFAGSTAGLATLSGWCLITLWLQSRNISADVMIAHSDVEFRAPLKTDLNTLVELPDSEVMGQFEQRLREQGRARLPLQVSLGEPDAPVLVLVGDYAARLR